MKRALLALSMGLAIHSPAWATWSVIAIDKSSGQVIIASATCVAQAGFPRRQPLGARDLMDVKYYAYIRITDDDIKPAENANPVKTLRMRYDAWKKAGSKPFSTVPTVGLTPTNP